MITCQKCGKENQDHYKFCLGCGAELSREVAAKPFARGGAPAEATHHFAEGAGEPAAAVLGSDSTHASPGAQAPRARPAPAPEPVQPAVNIPGHPTPGNATPGHAGQHAAPANAAAINGAATFVTCPQCEHHNPTSNRFCASCGYKLNIASVPAKAPGASPVVPSGGGVMLTALRADGTEAGSYTLPQSPSETVGRDTGSIFAGDSYLSPRHATFSRKGDRLYVGDARSLNGVYLKIRPNTPWPLRFGDVFRIGQEILRLEKLEVAQPSADGVQRLGSPSDGYVARLGLVIGRDTTGNAFPVPKGGLHLGRERGDVLFPEDGYVSGLHCRLGVGNDNSITLTDLGSSNGSFVRLRDEHPVSTGDILLMGQQLFRIDA